MSKQPSVITISGKELDPTVPTNRTGVLTNQLRWAIPSLPATAHPRLQQFFRGIDCPSWWEDVPIVVMDDPAVKE